MKNGIFQEGRKVRNKFKFKQRELLLATERVSSAGVSGPPGGTCLPAPPQVRAEGKEKK